ncbi:apoptosis-inducing factor 2, partial [Lecanoromycetidae sp. Uapishka_2]
MSNTHNIVILGVSYAGLPVAHGLLKALPALAKSTKKSYKVTMLSNSTHFWFNVGAPRAMLKPFPKDNMDSFIPVEKGFKQYPSELYEFVHAEITGLETEKRSVLYKLKNEQEELASDTQTLHYDTLVIATGSGGPSPLYALQGSHVPSLKAYEDIQARLPSAKSVMVVGGGAAGTETAGELGYMHGKKSASPKDITILSGGERLLPGLRPAISKRAQEILEDQGVKIEHNLRLKDSKLLGNGSTEVTLTDGSTRTVDILIVATGRKPASSYLPSSLLDAQGHVNVDAYLRVPSLESVYVCGDVASSSNGGIMYIMAAGPCVSSNILAELGGKGKGKEFKPMTTKETQFVPVGPEYGVGAAFGWWVPSMVIRQVKGKNFMFPTAMKTVMGTA